MVLWHLSDGGPPVPMPASLTLEQVRKAVRAEQHLRSVNGKVTSLLGLLDRGANFADAMDACLLSGDPTLYRQGLRAYQAWKANQSVED